MKIKEFEIKNLYGKYSFRHTFDEKVNIIVGNNGSFKTTLLTLLARAMSMVEKGRDKIIDEVVLTFDNGMTAHYNQFDGNLMQLANKATSDSRYKELAQKAMERSEGSSNISLNAEMLSFYQDNHEISEDDFFKVSRFDFISTFDVLSRNKRDESVLDYQLEGLQSEYGYYLSDVAKELTTLLSSKGNVTQEDFQKINYKKDLFISLINKSFSETEKQLSPDDSKLKFLLKNGSTINARMLSSGEKQLLIILLTVLLEREKEFILLMDEPEISMHISWQYDLIDMILHLNPNVQIILTTHSPMIFSNGWGDKAIHIEDITTNTQK